MLRFAELGRYARISVCVDSRENIDEINTAAIDKKVTIGCVVEVNVGQNRCGVEPGAAVVELAKFIQKRHNLEFLGIQCYQG